MSQHIFLLLALLVSLALAGWPSSNKKFYIGGNFTGVLTTDNKTVAVNNVATFSMGSQTWSALGNGFNGPVAAIYVDTFYTLYAAGSFSASGSVNTGPIAIWKEDRWEAITTTETSWSANSTVNSISVDCYNFPSTYKHPDCDIYIGGSFLLTSYGSTMANVAWFDGAAKKWMPMGVSTDENSPRRSEVVNKIYKKGGLGASDSKNFVWVGSSAGIRKFHTQQKKWTAPVDLGWTTPSGVINWIHYVRNSLSTDEIYLCGEFSFACQNGKTCTNVAKYDYSKKTFTAIAASQQLSGAVTACQMGDNDFFYVAGKASYGSKKYFLRVMTTTIESASWDTISNVAEVVQNPLTDLDVCTSGDPGCTTGSVALVGNNGFGGYYNAKDSTFNKFGLGIVGQPQCLTSTVSVSSASTTRGVSVLVGILLMLASLFFFL